MSACLLQLTLWSAIADGWGKLTAEETSHRRSRRNRCRSGSVSHSPRVFVRPGITSTPTRRGQAAHPPVSVPSPRSPARQSSSLSDSNQPIMRRRAVRSALLKPCRRVEKASNSLRQRSATIRASGCEGLLPSSRCAIWRSARWSQRTSAARTLCSRWRTGSRRRRTARPRIRAGEREAGASELRVMVDITSLAPLRWTSATAIRRRPLLSQHLGHPSACRPCEGRRCRRHRQR